MIFVDKLFTGVATDPQAKRVGARNQNQWCHLWHSEHDVEALKEFAITIGLRLEWFQDRPHFPHFDLTPGKRSQAISNGAVEKSLREFIKEEMEAGRWRRNNA